MCDWVGCQHLMPVAGSAHGFTMRSGGGVNVHDGQVLWHSLPRISPHLPRRSLDALCSYLFSPPESHIVGATWQIAKFGWLAQAAGDRISFEVQGGKAGARVHLAMVCSHRGVGSATVTVHREEPAAAAAVATQVGGGGATGALGAASALVGRLAGGYALVSSKRVQARWEQRTTQQCIVPLGAIGAGPHILTVEVDQLGQSKGGGDSGTGVKIFGIYAQDLL